MQIKIPPVMYLLSLQQKNSELAYYPLLLEHLATKLIEAWRALDNGNQARYRYENRGAGKLATISDIPQTFVSYWYANHLQEKAQNGSKRGSGSGSAGGGTVTGFETLPGDSKPPAPQQGSPQGGVKRNIAWQTTRAGEDWRRLTSIPPYGAYAPWMLFSPAGVKR